MIRSSTFAKHSVIEIALVLDQCDAIWCCSILVFVKWSNVRTKFKFLVRNHYNIESVTVRCLFDDFEEELGYLDLVQLIDFPP